MKRVPHKVEVSEITFKRLMSEFLESTHSTINKGNERLRKLIFMRMNETEGDAKERKKRMDEITNKVDDVVKTLGKDTGTAMIRRLESPSSTGTSFFFQPICHPFFFFFHGHCN